MEGGGSRGNREERGGRGGGMEENLYVFVTWLGFSCINSGEKRHMVLSVHITGRAHQSAGIISPLFPSFFPSTHPSRAVVLCLSVSLSRAVCL